MTHQEFDLSAFTNRVHERPDLDLVREMVTFLYQSLIDAGAIPDPAELHEGWSSRIDTILARATLTRPQDSWMQTGGRTGRHSEHLGHILAELQYLQRSHPGAKW